MPRNFGALTGLTELRIENNRITALPNSIANLTGLTKAMINNNQLVTPAAFFSVLDDGLNLTLERFPCLQITRQVPCRSCCSGWHRPNGTPRA